MVTENRVQTLQDMRQRPTSWVLGHWGRRYRFAKSGREICPLSRHKFDFLLSGLFSKLDRVPGHNDWEVHENHRAAILLQVH